MVANSDEVPADNYVRRAELVRVVDGDTLECRIDLGWKRDPRMFIRLLGVDTPEVVGRERPAGDYVTAKVRAFFEEHGNQLVIHSRRFDSSFGRALYWVWAGEVQLNAWLLDNRLAWPADDNGSVIGPRNLERLVVG